ncbi:ATPase AAA-2 domain protein [Gammaproteobacteria bacterium]
MAVNVSAEVQTAIDQAKQAVPEDGSLDIDLLLAALYHVTSLKERLPARLGDVLPPPSPRRTAVSGKVPVAEPLQPLLWDLLRRAEPLMPETFFQTLIDSEQGRGWLLTHGLSELELSDIRELLQPVPQAPGESLPVNSSKRPTPQHQAAVEALSSFGRMLTASEPPYKGVYGMDQTVQAMVRTLSRMKNRSVIVIGHSGTGKSAVVYELARRLYRGDESIPSHLRDLDIFELSPVFLRSGASMVGQYEERVKALLQVLEAHPRVLLFVDEIHSMFKSSMHEHGPFSDANEAFKGKLTSGTIACLGCTTYAEYRHYIEPDPALARRFTLIRLEAATPEATVKILEARRPRLEQYFSPPPLRIPDEMLQRTVELTEEYLPMRFQPAKSLQLLDDACAWCVTAKSRPEQVTEEALWSALEDMIGHSLIRSTTPLTEVDLFERLSAKIIGQGDTLRRVARAFVAGLGGWGKRSGPRGVFFFCGPTGVGKTETAVLLSRVLGGGKEAMIRVNCNILQGSGHDVGPATNILLGAPPGYVGYVRGQGGLLSKVRDTPECIVLFDEIEKADPGVAKLLLQIMDTGQIEDTEGNLLDFRRAYLIFTTNAGAVYEHHQIGFVVERDQDPNIPDADVKIVMNELRQLGYGEEFFGRVDEFFVFHGLQPDAVRRIVEMQLEALRASADVRGYQLAWSAEVVEYLSTRWQPRFGVRHLTTILRNRILEQLAVAEAQRELSGVKRIELRVLNLGNDAPRQHLAGLASCERDGETLWINLA